MRVSILGTGRSLPSRHVDSTALEEKLGTGGRISASGVQTRYFCKTETQIDLAVEAAQAAMENAGVGIGDVDLVLCGCAVPYQPIPSMAPLVMRQLDMDDGAAAAFDVNSTCLSFVSAFELAARMVAGGSARRALVVSSEVASRALPWQTHPDVAALFGDGAAAAIIGPSAANSASSVMAARLRSYPSAYEACEIGAGGTRFDFETEHEAFAQHANFMMDGKALFRVTSQHFKAFVQELLAEAGWTKDDVDLVVPHQASPAALEHMIRQTGFEPERVVQIAADYGNQVAASIPFALDLARREGRADAGSKVLLLGTSAGISFGGAALVL